ncbi:MAG: creatininase family protein [Deltaproteobacteria bacterium]|nr:creatininase family protein [Deltaproteobacteria bacterium]
MLIGECTMTGFKRALGRTKTLIIPFGTIEAHGTHLPLNTDTFIIREAVKKAADKAGVFMAPPVQYGVCTSTGQHPGTVGITPPTLRLLALDIVRDAYTKGLRNFILISGHGGGSHMQALKDAGETLAIELKGAKVAVACLYEILPKKVFDIIETEGDSHAGELETSLMLHLAPRLVKGRAKEEYPRFTRPVIAADKVKCWPGAVWGNPARAAAEKGELVFAMMVDEIAALARRMEKGKKTRQPCLPE